VHKITVLAQPKMQRSDYKEKIEIDHEWVERIGKTAYDLASNHIKNEEYNGHIIKSGDPMLLDWLLNNILIPCRLNCG
jgi:hypothetical protein